MTTLLRIFALIAVPFLFRQVERWAYHLKRRPYEEAIKLPSMASFRPSNR